MKFITEDELRNIYRNEPFTVYEPKVGERLTPGARQFLSDKRIRIDDGQSVKKEQRENIEKDELNLSECSLLSFHSMRVAEARLLQIGLELMELDVLMSQEIFGMQQYMVSLRNECYDRELEYSSCSGIEVENFETCMEDCFEVTGFHVQSENGRVIVKLHYLRCILRELESKLSDRRKKGVNRIINRLSQMICQAFGGNTCQKKN